MTKPVRTISLIFNLPDAKIIAFGGVPTGSMKAQFAAIAAGTINAYGWTFSANASEASTGRIIVAVAVFDVISVKNSTNAAEMTTMTTKLNPSNTVSLPPIHSARPVSLKPVASARPPPNKRRIPHGKSFDTDQSNTLPLY